jgi:DNA-binding NtrC family response regulator
VSVGTASENDVVLGDRAVSARHCRVEAGREGWQVRDLGSRNGTFVDGVRVSLARIDAGSTLRIGRTDLRLVARGGGAVPDDGLVASSPQMQAVLEQVARLAPLPYPILVTGESGSGKEGVARALHTRGPSASGPFVAVNAGGLPASLVESELFGHEKGAFTGAAATRRGVFEQADGGTLFFDEIGELPLELQARLLRVLETWEVRRLGGERSFRVNVRLLCATHRDLLAMVRSGTFREDLYYRVAQLAVHVPPLRDRPRDVEALADFFLAKERSQVGVRRFTEEAHVRLLVHPWPGNARELRNVVVRVAARSAGAWIGAEEVESVLREMGARIHSSVGLARVLELYEGNVAAAARSLGIARTTFRDRLRRERGDEPWIEEAP